MAGGTGVTTILSIRLVEYQWKRAEHVEMKAAAKGAHKRHTEMAGVRVTAITRNKQKLHGSTTTCSRNRAGEWIQQKKRILNCGFFKRANPAASSHYMVHSHRPFGHLNRLCLCHCLCLCLCLCLSLGVVGSTRSPAERSCFQKWLHTAIQYRIATNRLGPSAGTKASSVRTHQPLCRTQRVKRKKTRATILKWLTSRFFCVNTWASTAGSGREMITVRSWAAFNCLKAVRQIQRICI